MRLLALHLEGKACIWFTNLPKAKISSLPELIELFCKRWFPEKQRRWMPHVEHARSLFSKEIQSENQVEEVIVQHLIDDISNTVPKDEVLRANEYD